MFPRVFWPLRGVPRHLLPAAGLVVPCALLLVILGMTPRLSAVQEAKAAATATDAQAAFRLPDLSDAELQRFEPSIREQIRGALQQARRNPTAETVGALGLVLHAYEQYDRAAACYARARKLDPDAFRWVYYLALAQADAGQAHRAVVALREALRLNGANLPARLKLAELLPGEGEFEESQEIYTAILKERPSSVLAHYGLGRSLAERGDAAAAVESYRRAAEISPRFGAAHYALALLYRKLGERDKAQHHLAQYQANQGRRPPLEDPLLELIEAHKVGPYHHLERGRRLHAEGRHREAIEAFERVLGMDPDLVHAHVNLVAAHAALGAFDKAESHYRRAVALEPDLPEVHYNHGVLLLAQGRHDGAIAAFRRALASNPFYANAHNNLGYLLARERQHDEAIGHFRAALEADPAHRDAHFNLGRALQATGRGAEAIKHLLKTVTVEDEKTAVYLYYLADAYARQGALADAVRYARAARDRAASLGQVSLVQRIDEELARLKAARIPR